MSKLELKTNLSNDGQTSSSKSPGPPAGTGSSGRDRNTISKANAGFTGGSSDSHGLGRNDSIRRNDNQRWNHTEKRNDNWDRYSLRDNLRHIADSTLQILGEGEYFPPGQDGPYDLKVKIRWTDKNTRYYGPEAGEGGEILDSEFIATSKPYDANLKYRTRFQSTVSPHHPKRATLDNAQTTIYVEECSTLVGARKVHFALARNTDPSLNKKIGVLNFASAKRPGGGFIRGSQAQVRFLLPSLLFFFLYDIDLTNLLIRKSL